MAGVSLAVFTAAVVLTETAATSPSSMRELGGLRPLSTLRRGTGSPASFPPYSESFTVETLESTFNSQQPTVQQLIAQDNITRRSMMLAQGPLVHGVLQQIKRCDIHPLGWFADIGGPSMEQLECKNTSINSDPNDCQWTPFWEIPANASGPTPDKLNGTKCGRWDWWEENERHSFWGTSEKPLRIAKVWTPHPAPVTTWYIDFSGFSDVPPSLSEFDPVPAAGCTPARTSTTATEVIL